MSSEHEEMIAALRQHVVPVLRQRGFTGSFPHFRCCGSKAMHLISFQFNKWGGSFVAETASCPLDGITTAWGERISPEKAKAGDVHPSLRVRLGSMGTNSDHWFGFDEHVTRDRHVQAAKGVLRCLEGWNPDRAQSAP